MFEEVDARQQRLNGYKPFDADTLARLDAVFEPWFIYGSNALEGNTLTLGDTIYLIREGKLPGGKREEEYLEVKGQQAAYGYLREAVTGQFRLTETLVREFHTLLTQKLDANKYHPGQYKVRDNQVRLPDGSLLPYVSHVETAAAMQELIRWYQNEAQGMHPVQRAAALHYKFIRIHPFLDGNGRTARLLANLSMLQGGHVLTVFRADQRRRLYLEALHATDTSIPINELRPDHPNLNFFPFTSYVEQELLWSYDLALDVLEGRVLVSTEDLVRRFAPMERSGLDAAGIAGDEQSRLEANAKAVRELNLRISSQVTLIAAGLNRNWVDIETMVGDDVGGARDLLEARPFIHIAERRAALGFEGQPLRGEIGLIRLIVTRKAGSLVQMAIPNNACEFIVHAEPHAMVLSAIWSSGRTEAPPLDAAFIRLPINPLDWRDSEMNRFVLDQVGRFLAATEAEIKRLNSTT